MFVNFKGVFSSSSLLCVNIQDTTVTLNVSTPIFNMSSLQVLYFNNSISYQPLSPNLDLAANLFVEVPPLTFLAIGDQVIPQTVLWDFLALLPGLQGLSLRQFYAYKNAVGGPFECADDTFGIYLSFFFYFFLSIISIFPFYLDYYKLHF